MASTRNPDGERFAPSYDPELLTEVLRTIARHANPEDPRTVAPKAYEAARAPAGYPDAPGARATRRALGNLGWYAILHLAFDDERSLMHNVAIAERPAARANVSEQEAVAALRIIANRLGANTLRPRAYDTEVAGLERASGPAGLPTATRIETVLKTDTEMGWDRGLRLAGLSPRMSRSRAGVAKPDAIEMFLDELGCLPTSEDLDEYAKRKGFALSRRLRHGESIEILRRRRQERGLPCPSAPPPRDQRPVIDVEPGSELELPARRVRSRPDGSDKERCITGLVLAYDEAARRRLRFTQKVHRALAVEFAGRIPAPSVVDRRAREAGETARQWREEAQRRRAQRRL